MLKRKKLTGLILSILLLTLIFSVMLNAKSSEPPFVDSNLQVVYEGRVLTDTPGEKRLPILSPAEDNIAFLYEGSPENGFSRKIGIINLRTGTIADTLLENSHATTFFEIVWLDKESVGIIGHVNPSLEEFYLINLSNNSHDVYHGIGFTIDHSTGNLAYTLPQPHFGEGEKGKNKIVDSDGNIYYESPSNVLIMGGPNFNMLGTQVVFFEYDMLEDETQLVEADRNIENKFVNIKKRRWDFELGKIRWKTQTLIEIESTYHYLDFDLLNSTVEGKIDTQAKITLDGKLEQEGVKQQHNINQ